MSRRPTCDHCGSQLHADRNGFWVADDGTSDCPESEKGHEVDGRIRY